MSLDRITAFGGIERLLFKDAKKKGVCHGGAQAGALTRQPIQELRARRASRLDAGCLRGRQHPIRGEMGARGFLLGSEIRQRRNNNSAKGSGAGILACGFFEKGGGYSDISGAEFPFPGELCGKILPRVSYGSCLNGSIHSAHAILAFSTQIYRLTFPVVIGILALQILICLKLLRREAEPPGKEGEDNVQRAHSPGQLPDGV